MRYLRTIALAVLVGATMLTSGCIALLAGAAGAAGGIVYLKGQLESYEAQPFDTVVAAVRKTIKQEKYGDTTSTIENGEFSMRGRDVDDTWIWIRADRKDDKVTRLRIRYSVVGDEDAARRILKIIRSNY
jgi:hypothetical protein